MEQIKKKSYRAEDLEDQQLSLELFFMTDTVVDMWK